MADWHGLIEGTDGVVRCAWHGNLPDYLHYHDNEWGRPVADDRQALREDLPRRFPVGPVLADDPAQARELSRRLSPDFDFDKVAEFTDGDIERLWQDAGIVRHRGKIVSTINNARRAQEMVAEAGSLAAWFWRFEPGSAERPAKVDLAHAARQSDDGRFRCASRRI